MSTSSLARYGVISSHELHLDGSVDNLQEPEKTAILKERFYWGNVNGHWDYLHHQHNLNIVRWIGDPKQKLNLFGRSFVELIYFLRARSAEENHSCENNCKIIVPILFYPEESNKFYENAAKDIKLKIVNRGYKNVNLFRNIL